MRLLLLLLLLITLAGCGIFRKKKCDCPDLRKSKRIAETPAHIPLPDWMHSWEWAGKLPQT